MEEVDRSAEVQLRGERQTHSCLKKSKERIVEVVNLLS